MYTIQDVGGLGKNDIWEVRKNDTQILFRGGFKAVVKYAVTDLGFDLSDFERIVGNVIKHEHNTLHFDRSKRLTATSREPVKSTKTG